MTSQQNLPTAVQRIDSAGNFTVRNGDYDEYNKTTSADVGVRTRFKTGGVGHTLVATANSLQRETGYFYQLTTPATGVPSNIYNPSPLPAINFMRGTPSRSADAELRSIEVVDTMSFLDERLLFSLDLRDQTIN